MHHVPDSHMNAYIRMKFAVTEDAPAIKAYDEAKWAELPEGEDGPADMSVALLEALHRRWVMFLRGLTDAEFAKAYVHPELGPRLARRSADAVLVALPSPRRSRPAGARRHGLGSTERLNAELAKAAKTSLGKSSFARFAGFAFHG